jgi:hypothetical protein
MDETVLVKYIKYLIDLNTENLKHSFADGNSDMDFYDGVIMGLEMVLKKMGVLVESK